MASMDLFSSSPFASDGRGLFLPRLAASSAMNGGQLVGAAPRPAGNVKAMAYLCRPGAPGLASQLSAPDRRVLDWFLRRTVSKLQGVFPFPFWETLIPQACSNEPVVLSCVLALGSTHKSSVLGRQYEYRQGGGHDFESITLRHYNAAINSLSGMQSDASKASVRVVLIACLAFVTIEYLQQRFEQGRLHLQHGLHILAGRASQDTWSDPVDDWLMEAFDRLDIQARLLSNKASNHDSFFDDRDTAGSPITLNSLHEARARLDRLISKAFRLQRESNVAESSGNVEHLFQALIKQQRLQQDLTAWLQGYRVLKPKCLSAPLRDQIALRLLLVYHTMAVIVTAAALHSENELVFDQHRLQFQSIVTSTKEIIEAAVPLASSHVLNGTCTDNFGYTSDIGLIPPLYYAALKCRDPEIRREAMSLMTLESHREGIWYGPTATLITGEVMRLEESSGLGQPRTSCEIGATHSPRGAKPSSPRPWRLTDIQVDLPATAGRDLVLVGRRKLEDGTWAVIERRHNGVEWY
ncbi:hypothetical protein FDECE_12655 [Fusarium decemcellulare]|nr:hypothetical protein FDECE_12655 [Fusarium decemcellulare]